MLYMMHFETLSPYYLSTFTDPALYTQDVLLLRKSSSPQVCPNLTLIPN
jgi:hypothetical protein